MTIRDGMRWATERLRQSSREAARWEAEVMLAHALGIGRSELYASPERALSQTEWERLRKLIKRRCAGEPLQYLTGYTEFYNCQLEVAPAALIPRPETEELVEHIVRNYAVAPARVLDLGTGSGAIVIALARAWPTSSFVAVDLSVKALALARRNAVLNGVAARIQFVRSDWFSNIDGEFDLIVSNPPYVPTKYLAYAQREVRYEPRIALDGGESGLEALARIIRASPQYLCSSGALYLEIGYDQGARVRELLRQSGAFKQIEILHDMSGHERFARAIKRG